MECRAYAIRMDSQSGEHLGKDRKVSSAAGGNLSGMHKTEKTVKESRMNYMYSHLCDGTLAFVAVIVLGSIVATQILANSYRFHPALGFNLFHIYPPWSYFLWSHQ